MKKTRPLAKAILLSLFLALFTLNSSAQKVTLSFQNETFEKVLNSIKQQTGLSLVFSEQLVNLNRKVSIKANSIEVEDALKQLLIGTNLGCEIKNNKLYLVEKKNVEQKNTLTRSKKITGLVTDEKGDPIIGASILVKPENTGTITDINGNFSIVASESSDLSITYVGYKPTIVKIGEKNTVNVRLEENSHNLNEVVVVGYGSQKKLNLTGAIDVIGSKELADRTSPTVSQLLQGLSPSLNFAIGNDAGFQPGAAMDITIRGIGSLNGGKPYVIIDGFPGDLNNLNPNNIESISVLKDASASAIYGARAPYGVILITTKNGKRDKKISATYSGTVSVNTAQELPKSLDSYTWARVQNEAGDNSGGHPFSDKTIDQIIAFQAGDWDYLKQSMPNWPEGATTFGAFPESKVWNNANLNYANNDWWKIYFGSSVNQKHDFSLSGGSKTASYYFSAGHLDQSSVLNFGTDTYSRDNLLGKFDLNITDWWKFSWETRFSKTARVKPAMTREGDYSFMFRHISRAYPTTPLTDGFGHYITETHIPSIEDAGNNYNNQSDFWNNLKTEIKIIKGWKINADFAYNFSLGAIENIEKTIYKYALDQSRYPMGETQPNFIEKTNNTKNYWTTNIYSTYDFEINSDHNFLLMAGMQFEHEKYSSLYGKKSDMIVQDVPSFQTSTGVALLSEFLSQKATQGYFSRFTYNYKEKYLLEANARYDGSYVFKKGKRWGFFPSFSAGWNVHQERFWANITKYINTLKIRGSWGQLGNQNVQPYSDLELVNLNSGKLDWIFNYGTTRPIGYTTAPSMVNQNLTWETATTKNAGFNISFLDSRLTADVDIFERLTENMIGPSESRPGVIGANIPASNNSTLRTRGWEVALNWKQTFKSGLSFFVNLSLSDDNSVITKYNNATGLLSSWYEGQKLGEIWGYTVNDLFRTQTEVDDYLSKVDLTKIAANWNTGDVKYEDTNSDGKVNNGSNTLKDHGDLSIIGNSRAHYQYGINAGLNFKGFDFSMLWRGVAKKDVFYNRFSNIYWGFTGGWWESTIQPRNLDYFRDTPGTKYSGVAEGDANLNTDAFFPRPYLNNNEEAKNKNYPNTRYLQDASFLRMQNIQLGYSLPDNLVSKLKLQKIRVALSGENLITFTKVPDGIDPVAPVGSTVGFSLTTQQDGRLTYGADKIYSLTLTATF